MIRTQFTPYFALLATALAAPAWAAEATVAPLTPYRIQVLTAVESRPDLAGLAEALPSWLASRLNGVLGGPWLVKAAAASAEMQAKLLGNFESVDAETAGKGAADCDKVMLVAISGASDGYRLTVREVDVASKALGAVVRRTVPQQARLCDASARAVFDAFSPIAAVQSVDDKQVKLLVRGSGLAPRDKELGVIAAGKPLIPPGKPEGEPALLVAGKVTPESTTAILVGPSSLSLAAGTPASPVAAAGVAHPRGATTLVFVSKADPKRPVPGIDVESLEGPGAIPLFVGRSGGDGKVVVPATPDPVRLILVKSGQDVLARIPLVPGAAATMVLPVAADDRRLESEAAVEALASTLRDLTYQHALLCARGEARLQAKQLEEAKAILAELEKLPTAAQFAQRVTEQQRLLAAEDPAAKKRLDDRCAELAKLAEAQLAAANVQKLADAIKKFKP